jgi:hypothetical protein
MLNIIQPNSSGKLKPIQLKNVKPPSARNTIDRPLSSKVKIDCDSRQNENKKEIEEKKEKDKISNFLKNLDLEKYTDTFFNNGINKEEKIQYLNYENLKLLNIPYVHCKRILSKVKEMNKKIFSKSEKKNNKLNTSEYEEIILPNEEDEINENEEEQKNKFNKALNDFKKNHTSLISSEYSKTHYGKFPKFSETSIGESDINENESENNKSITVEFGEYVENSNNNDTYITNLNISNNKIENKLIKSKDVSISTSPTKKYKDNYNIDTSKPSSNAKQFFPLYKSKTLCYQCLHMILQEHCINKYKKPFCSLHCLDIFENKCLSKCANCSKKIEIIYAIPSINKNQTFYCSNECFNKAEPNGNNKINTSQIIDPQHFRNSSSDSNEPVIDLLDE